MTSSRKYSSANFNYQKLAEKLLLDFLYISTRLRRLCYLLNNFIEKRLILPGSLFKGAPLSVYSYMDKCQWNHSRRRIGSVQFSLDNQQPCTNGLQLRLPLHITISSNRKGMGISKRSTTERQAEESHRRKTFYARKPHTAAVNHITYCPQTSRGISWTQPGSLIGPIPASLPVGASALSMSSTGHHELSATITFLEEKRETRQRLCRHA